MSLSVAIPEVKWGWLRGPRFDPLLIFGTLALGVSAVAAVFADARNFYLILFADLWLLGYHHVVSTYTRLCFDRESFRQHRFLILGLGPIMLAVTVTLASMVGIWIIFSVYLYWQWFHYARQSWGVAQVYRRKAGDTSVSDGDLLTRTAFSLVPLWGILHRSWQAPETFIGQPIHVIPVPGIVVDAVAVAAIAAVGLWAARRVAELWQGRAPLALTLYQISHFVVFYAAYIAIPDITIGWLLVNIWHNSQYILFVWLFNTNRFAGGVDARAKFLSWISQPQRWWAYAAVCLVLTSILYRSIDGVIRIAAPEMLLTATVVVYQAINFHHYVVDSVLWKVRRKPLQEVLGLNAR